MGQKLDKFTRKIEANANRTFLPFFKFPEGRTDLRIVPAVKGGDEDGWFLVTGIHYNVFDKPVYCPFEHEMNEDPCAICQMVAELRKDGLNEDAGRMAVRRRAIVRAIIRGEEEKGVQIVNLPVTVFMEIYAILKDTDTWGDILSSGPKGRDIRILKTGKGLNTKYQVQALPKTNPLLPTPALTNDVLASLQPIDTLITAPTSSEVAAMMRDKLGYAAFGSDDDDTDTDEVEEEAASSDEEWEDTTAEETGDDTVPFGEEEAWLEEEANNEDDDAPPPSVTAMAQRDQGSVKTNLASELGKKHKVSKKG